MQKGDFAKDNGKAAGSEKGEARRVRWWWWLVIGVVVVVYSYCMHSK
jgi:hypothetical protein